jgi:hypothetical protein
MTAGINYDFLDNTSNWQYLKQSGILPALKVMSSSLQIKVTFHYH